VAEEILRSLRRIQSDVRGLQTRVYQEHGLVRATSGVLPFEELPLGSRVRVLPNHVCMTAAMYDRYNVVVGGEVREWSRANGW
jgi:D-serine deaminase-like pyridoxal phosphate-dependent protein